MKKQNEKIAVIRPGIHTVDEQFCHYLVKEGFEGTLIAPKKSLATPNEIFNPNYKVRLLKALNCGPFKDFPIFLNLYSYLRKENFDIVQASEDFQCFTWVAALYAKFNHKLFFPMEDRYYFPRKKFDRYLYKIFKIMFFPLVWTTANKIICRSTAALRFTENSLNNKKLKSKLVFLPIGVNTDIFFPVKTKVVEKNLKIITVGRLINHKDYPTLLKAVKYLKDQKMTSVDLTIVGQGPLKHALLDQIRKDDLAENIKIYEKVEFSKLKTYYSNHQLFVISSISEGMGAVVLEAMACGLPLGVSRVGGMIDFVENGKNGYIFSAGDYKDLANKILKLTDKQTRRKLGQQSLKKVKERFDWQVLIKEYAKVLLNAYYIKEKSVRLFL